MLKLRDFFHLPQLDALVSQLVAEESGLIILAGINARPVTSKPDDSFTPSGLSAMFNILLQEILLAHPLAQAVVVAEERSLARVPRQISRRVRLLKVDSLDSYAQQIEIARRQRPGLLVIDRLCEETLPGALESAQNGLRVLAQMDSVLCGPAVARQLIEMGAGRDQLSALRWVLTNQRMSVLCENCRQPADPHKDAFPRLRARYPHLSQSIDQFLAPNTNNDQSGSAKFYRAGTCERCKGTGYQGEIAIFDIFRNDPMHADFFAQPSLLSLEEYALHLAAQGILDLDDLLGLENDHLRRTYQMLTASEHALTETNAELNSKLIELEASNRVLIQRTEVLMSLQDLGQMLIATTDLKDLAARICRRAGELCGADRVTLCLLGTAEAEKGGYAEVLAVRGWDKSLEGTFLERKDVSSGMQEMRVTRYMQPPNGFRAPPSDTPEPTIKMGLRVPLMAQAQQVGVMIIQSTQKDYFTPGETALLQTFANQAALAIHRARLIEDLRAKISQLEAAQAELVKKERLERELELAREVQQNMLPHSFPEVHGFAFSARNEPARQVGGDFYDIFVLDQDHFGIVIADVADKGMPAALYMALTRSLLLAEARRAFSPREALLNVNRLLLELGDLSGFVSVFYGVIDCVANQLTYTRAGHERPLLLRDKQVSPLAGDGTVLGILDGSLLNLSEEQIDLAPGDRLVMYTDGLTDVADADGRFSGRVRFEEIIQAHASLPGDELCGALFDDLNAFRGHADQFDDMTLLVMEVQG